MSKTLLLKNGLIFDLQTNQKKHLDVRINGEKIVSVDADLAPATDDEVIDIKGCWVCPGFIDIACEIGDREREKIATGSKAAAAGGYTTLLAHTGVEKPLDSPDRLSLFNKRCSEQSLVEILPMCTLTLNGQGKDMVNMVELTAMGAQAFSDFDKPQLNLSTLRRALDYARLTGKLVVLRPEDSALSENGVIHESKQSTAMGMPGIPYVAETAALAKELELIRLTNRPVHFARLSSARSSMLIKQAKDEGLPVSADVSVHHLAFSVDDITDFSSPLKLSPPVREESDRLALIKALKEGSIDVISSGHRAVSLREQSNLIQERPTGLVSLETAFSLAFESLVQPGFLSDMEMIKLFTVNPARVLGITMPSITVGSVANLAIFDPHKSYVYQAGHGFSLGRNTALEGRKISGQILLTIYRGAKVFTVQERLIRV